MTPRDLDIFVYGFITGCGVSLLLFLVVAVFGGA